MMDKNLINRSPYMNSNKVCSKNLLYWEENRGMENLGKICLVEMILMGKLEMEIGDRLEGISIMSRQQIL
jgi:hypothetical protein